LGRYQDVRGACRPTFGLYPEAREVYLEGHAGNPELHDADLKAEGPESEVAEAKREV
jgi:hypothetical protein